MPHTLHLPKGVQQENQKGGTLKEMTSQQMLSHLKDQKRERMTNQTETTTVAQPYDRKEKEGL